MPPVVRIDRPSGREISQPHFHLYGWYTSETPSETIQVSLNNQDIPLFTYRRPDVEAAYPQLCARGFSAFIWLSKHTSNDNLQLRLSASLAGRRYVDQNYVVKADAVESSASQLRYKQSKKQWLATRLKCPACGTTLNVEPTEAIVCPRCSTNYPINNDYLNMVPPEFRTRGEIQFQGNVCSHGYDRDVVTIVEEAKARGGMVLDCGAGYRGVVEENIVTTEITPFPSTDVLATNHCLPFQDAIFDAVLSLHVLEHVSDPFLCAQELVRVTKPGGIIFAVTPMIVPEHGYPHHFFNPTMEGLKRLFATSTDVESVYVPAMGHPINGVRSVLDLYLVGLPDKLKTKFKRMTVEQLLAGSLETALGKDIATHLGEEARRRLAANYALRARKTG